MTKLTITYIGTPKDVDTKYGKKQKNSIKASQHGDNFLSYWVSPQTKDWAVGKEIEVAEVKPREYNGKAYYDIVMPKVDNRPNNDAVMRLLTEIANRQVTLVMEVRKIVDHLSNKSRLDRTSENKPVPFTEDINPDEIPM